MSTGGLDYDQVRNTLRECREAKGLSQAYIADGLDCSQANVARLENGKQPITVEVLIRWSKLLGISLVNVPSTEAADGGSYWVAPQEVDPDVIAPTYMIASIESPGPGDRDIAWLRSSFFPASKAFREILGAQIPSGQLAGLDADTSTMMEGARQWAGDILKNYGLKRSKLDGLTFVPALRSRDIGCLTRPEPQRQAPIAPRLKTTMRGPWMVDDQPRIAVDPGTLKVTVLTDRAAVLAPLRLLVPRQHFDEECPLDERRTPLEHQCFRFAALAGSTWGQEWMRSRGRLWFTPGEGPFRDLPVPARLWIDEDEEGLRVESLARRIWEGTGDRDKLMKELDECVVQLMAELRPRKVARPRR
jgi:transcriptional regulator with XRE-family HTH domain